MSTTRVNEARRDRDVGRFGRWARSYDKSILQRLFFAPLQDLTLDEAMALLPNPRAILDIGCGTGLLLRRARGRFPASHLVGIDLAPEMVAVARQSAPEGGRMSFAHAYAEQLPFRAATFDLVLTTMSFHHWADQPKALNEVRRVLVKGGLFALTDIMKAGLLGFILARSSHGRFNAPAVFDGMLAEAALLRDRDLAVPRLGGTVRIALARAIS